VTRLVGTFPPGDNAGHWPPQRANNTILALAVTRILISKGGSGTKNNQEALAQAGAIKKIIDLALSHDSPSTVSAAALHACADLLRGNYNVQAYFSTFLVPSPLAEETPVAHKRSSSEKSQQSQILVLNALLAMTLTSVAPYTYDQRLAASQCIQGFIHNNEEGRQGLLERIIKTYHEDAHFETPQPHNLLFYILNLDETTRKDPYRVWFACTVLLHLLHSSERCKEKMREISIGDTASGEEPVSALQQINANISSTLLNSYDQRIAVGYLMLLTIWLYDDASGVIEFLEEGSGIQTLVGCVAQGRDGIYVTGLSAILLGVCVEFNSPISSIPP
jgi:intracellular protein transport protein USO1